MVLSLSTLGRVFCGICPHGFIGKYLTKIGLNKKISLRLIAFPFASIVVIAYMSLNLYTGYVFKTYGAKKAVIIIAL